ncbi:MAG: membrane protein insertase YidC [Oscillospiraceae bacterium]|nr:membrane protein insertase YidC [Oscillospiraceae bacterium]
MGIVGEILGTPLGYIMKVCYDIINDYGFSIIIFTVFTKVILFPISLWVQKNSIKMVRMQPYLNALKYQYIDDKDALLDAQSELYKKEKYNPFASTIPLLFQIPLIFGLIDVVYRPLKHILQLPQAAIDAFTQKTAEILGTTQLASSPELIVMQCINDQNNYQAFMSLQNGALSGSDVGAMIKSVQSMNMNFFGFDLAAKPEMLSFNLLFLIPVLAGLSAFIMCFVQNKINVLQIEQTALAKWGQTIFMIAFSTYFAFLVPAGVGLYWIFGNLFSIPVMQLVNAIYNPRKYIDYKALNKLKLKAKENNKIKKENNRLSKKYYREICKNNNLQNMNLMFYSEQSGFYKYFENIIDALLKKSDETIYYVTSDPKDQIFDIKNPRIKSYYISGNHLIALMMKLECKMVVMTTPDLEKYHIKRSKVRKNIEYVYVDHGCTSLNLTYRSGALDHFDTIFAVSRNQGIEIREMEKLRGTKRKMIVKCGYGLIDNMIASYSRLDKIENKKPVILIAPSWQYDNILDSCLDNILTELVCNNYKVIVRPHPQYIKRFPVQMESIIEKYKDKLSEDFIIETDFSSNVTVYTADMLITDWSSIAYEFSFTTDKPTLFINTQMKIVNKDYDKIKLKPFDIFARDIVGKAISKEETVNISCVVDSLLENRESYVQSIRKLKNSYFYNLGHSGEVAADYIIERLSNRKNCTAGAKEAAAV